MKVLHTIFLLSSAVSVSTISLTDLCRRSPGYYNDHTMYGGEQVYRLAGGCKGVIDQCTVVFKNPPAGVGGTFNLSITFEPEYNIGYNVTTRMTRSSSDKGLKVSFSGKYFVGTQATFFKGLRNSTSQVGPSLRLGPHEVYRSSPTAGTMLILQYKGELPMDQLTMKLNLTCTPGPCSSTLPTTPSTMSHCPTPSATPSTTTRPTAPLSTTTQTANTAAKTTGFTYSATSTVVTTPTTEVWLTVTNLADSYRPSVLNLLLSLCLPAILVA